MALSRQKGAANGYFLQFGGFNMVKTIAQTLQITILRLFKILLVLVLIINIAARLAKKHLRQKG